MKILGLNHYHSKYPFADYIPLSPVLTDGGCSLPFPFSVLAKCPAQSPAAASRWQGPGKTLFSPEGNRRAPTAALSLCSTWQRGPGSPWAADNSPGALGGSLNHRKVAALNPVVPNQLCDLGKPTSSLEDSVSSPVKCVSPWEIHSLCLVFQVEAVKETMEPRLADRQAHLGNPET